MRLEWLEDLLAVLETDSLNDAAERRFITQPAFSRRLQAVEEYLGASLVDRSHKPARARPLLVEQHERIRSLTRDLRTLARELKRQDNMMFEQVVIASQHALTTTLCPELVRRTSKLVPGGILLRSANFDECQAMLFARQVHLILTYRSRRERRPDSIDFPQELLVATDQLIPVIGNNALDMVDAALATGELPVVAYPSRVFLGRMFALELQPYLADRLFVRRQAETALTLAAMQLALAGIGVAWLPRALAAGDIESGRLVELTSTLPQCSLDIVATRLTRSGTSAEISVWEALNTLALTRSPTIEQE